MRPRRARSARIEPITGANLKPWPEQGDITHPFDPSFSTTKKGKTWSAARDLGALVALGLSCLAPGGTLYVSTNQRGLRVEKFQEHVEAGFREARRPLQSIELATLPLDFRTLPGEAPYLKAAWAS